MRIEVLRPTKALMEGAMHTIRTDDLAEWYAGTGSCDIPSLLSYTYGGDCYAKVAVLDGAPLMAFGVDSLGSGPGSVGSVWLFASDQAEKHKLSLHRALLPYLEEMQGNHFMLSALSDARNAKHHRWLEWLGFTFAEDTFAGPFGLPFKLYIRETPCA